MSCGRWFACFGAVAVVCGSLVGCKKSDTSEPPEILALVKPKEPRLPAFEWKTNSEAGERVVVELSNLSEPLLEFFNAPTTSVETLGRVLRVYVQSRSGGDPFNRPPMAGRCEMLQNRLRYESDFPPTPGMTYWAMFNPRQVPELAGLEGAVSLISTNIIPLLRLESTNAVQAVYPTADVLPENLLKFYLRFTGPMSRGSIYEHIRLLRDNGEPVDLPFLEIDEELWNPGMTRLTLFIDPGRIKRGVRPLEEVGPALEEGNRYTLVVDQAWKDAQGLPLRESFRKEFLVGPPDREKPDAQTWLIEPPAAGTRAPLVMSFPEPMDYGLARRVIRVVDDKERGVLGTVSLENEEESWIFVPDQPWKSGEYQVRAEMILEDLAGNSLGRLFEVDVTEKPEPANARQEVWVPFSIL